MMIKCLFADKIDKVINNINIINIIHWDFYLQKIPDYLFFSILFLFLFSFYKQIFIFQIFVICHVMYIERT